MRIGASGTARKLRGLENLSKPQLIWKVGIFYESEDKNEEK